MPDCLKFRVEADEPVRLDVYLAENTEFTRSAVKNFADKGRILLNGKPCKAGKTLSAGDEIEMDARLEDAGIRPVDIPLDIVYEDDDIAVVNKQRGLTVHAGNGTGEETLVNALLFHLEHLSGVGGELRPGIVHRIDKNTTGLLVVAKNDVAHRSLSEQIAEKSCRRIYRALLVGNLSEDEGDVVAPIGRNRKDRTKMDVVPEGRYAKTHYRVLERFEGFCLTEFELSTGRTHQIRVHAKHLGHPVAGDAEYCGTCRFKTEGQLLHAGKLELTHPRTGERMSFEAELPEDFKKILFRLRYGGGAAF